MFLKNLSICNPLVSNLSTETRSYVCYSKNKQTLLYLSGHFTFFSLYVKVFLGAVERDYDLGCHTSRVDSW